MILYDLRCVDGHRFEGWFRVGADFEAQVAAGQLSCPVCGDQQVSKAPMAPRVARRVPAPAEVTSASEAEPDATTSPPSAGAPAPAAAPKPDPATVLHALRQVRRVIESTCEPVGERFAEEARAMHEGEIAPRPIYGSSTPAETQALEDDGIPFGQIPWLPLDDA